MADWFGKDVFKLGFGLMRLPKNPDGSIDIPQVSAMTDRFLEAGGTYFDTAYVYDGGLSEEAAKAALTSRYPRDRYTLCTKLNAGVAKDAQDARQQFYTSLERTGAGYFDYYLLHALGRGNRDKYDEYGLWDFVKGLKEQGLVRYWGFSFHDSPEMLDELLTAHPDVDFIQLQINYADWENPGVQSRRCWEVARRHGKSFTVMEPVKGGHLADPIPAVQKLFRDADPEASFAAWAIRYAASLEGVLTVLSGMSSLEQMEDNLSYMRNFQPMTEAEQAVVEAARLAMDADKSVPCTACHYCTDGCPMSIPIPEIFAVKNYVHRYAPWGGGKQEYREATEGKGRASECIGCGQCETACPQHLPVIELLKDCVEFEKQ